MKVAFLDVTGQWRELGPRLEGAWRRVMDSGQFILGPETTAFESEFAMYCGARHAIGVGNGLDALRLSLLAFGIGRGDEVVVPAHTFIATWLAVSATGASPIGADADDATMNLSPAAFEAAITTRTKAVIPVHMCGTPVDLDHIREVASRRGLLILEDAAQAHGALWRGRRVGSIGAAGAFSFYPAKNLGATGDGGCIVTDDPTVADAVRLQRNYGSTKKYAHEVKGGNTRLDELQAALLREKLPFLDDWNRRRSNLASRYLEGLSRARDLVLPAVPSGAESAWHLFAVRHPNRDGLREHLAASGIETLIHYPTPVHLSQAYSRCALTRGSFPVAERISMTELSLPMGPHMPMSEVDYVIESTIAFCGER